jgi:hypothetical protein
VVVPPAATGAVGDASETAMVDGRSCCLGVGGGAGGGAGTAGVGAGDGEVEAAGVEGAAAATGAAGGGEGEAGGAEGVTGAAGGVCEPGPFVVAAGVVGGAGALEPRAG